MENTASRSVPISPSPSTPTTPSSPPQPHANPLQKPQRNNLLIAGLVATFLALAGTAGFFAYKYFQTQPSQPTATPLPSAASTNESNPTADWETYTSKLLPISFKYPSDAEVGEQADGRIYLRIGPEVNITSVDICPEFHFSIAPNNETIPTSDPNLQSSSIITLGNRTAIRVDFPPNTQNTPCISSSIVIPNPTNKAQAEYTITMQHQIDKHSQLFNLILSTVQFLDQNGQTASWKVFSSNTLGFTLKYPNEWQFCTTQGASSYFINQHTNCGPPYADFFLQINILENTRSVEDYSPPGVASAYDAVPKQTKTLGTNRFVKQAFRQVRPYTWNDTERPAGPVVFFYDIVDTPNNRVVEFYKHPNSTTSETIIELILSTFKFTN